MMQPVKAAFYVYAENPQQLQDLEDVLLQFVAKQYDKGVLVTAPRLAALIRKAIDNPIATEFLK